MSDTKFPLCEKLGLVIMRSHWAGHAEGHEWQYAVSARDIEALLARAPVVYGIVNPANEWTFFSRTAAPSNGDTHRARFLLIEPLAPPEPEEIALLREYVAKDLMF